MISSFKNDFFFFMLMIIIVGFFVTSYVSLINDNSKKKQTRPEIFSSEKIQNFVGQQTSKIAFIDDPLPLNELHRQKLTLNELYRQKLQNCVISQTLSEDEFYAEVHRAKKCKLNYAFGGHVFKVKSLIVGHKVVCMDEPFKPVKNNCTVLSFGIYTDWSFDDAMSDYGCKIYAFDPFNGMKEHKRDKNIHFYPIGISDTNKLYDKGPLKGTPFMMTYRRVLEFLNLEKATIDYLKVDVEYSEVKMFNNIFREYPELLANVKQIGMEIHPRKDPKRRQQFYEMMVKFRCLSFRKIFHENNPVTKYKYKNREEAPDYELVWINEAWQN